MSKKALLISCMLVSVVVACNWVKRTKEPHAPNIAGKDSIIDDVPTTDGSWPSVHKPALPAPDNAKSEQMIDLQDHAVKEYKSPIKNLSPSTHFDTKALDERLMQEAKTMGKEPKDYRMLIRTDPDDTKIYRMLGMHVIVNPNGEEVFLPDEI